MTQQGFISLLTLNAADCSWLEIKDTYSCHRVVCSLFGLHEGANLETHPRMIQWRLITDSYQGFKLLVFSDTAPQKPTFGTLQTRPLPDKLLSFDFYRFSVRVNPTRRDVKSKKLIPICDADEIVQWFSKKAEGAGFAVDTKSTSIERRSVESFRKGSGKITMFQVDLSGHLRVTDREKFIQTFFRGFGRGRAFGCGLLQIVPIVDIKGVCHE